ncbi:hypothetical protein MMC14_001477 [Varicellaria rhodocarpa]|nr:hypothetical protein [Varicellaria rhodocarpa]
MADDSDAMDWKPTTPPSNQESVLSPLIFPELFGPQRGSPPRATRIGPVPTSQATAIQPSLSTFQNHYGGVFSGNIKSRTTNPHSWECWKFNNDLTWLGRTSSSKNRYRTFADYPYPRRDLNIDQRLALMKSHKPFWPTVGNQINRGSLFRASSQHKSSTNLRPQPYRPPLQYQPPPSSKNLEAGATPRSVRLPLTGLALEDSLDFNSRTDVGVSGPQSDHPNSITSSIEGSPRAKKRDFDTVFGQDPEIITQSRMATIRAVENMTATPVSESAFATSVHSSSPPPNFVGVFRPTTAESSWLEVLGVGCMVAANLIFQFTLHASRKIGRVARSGYQNRHHIAISCHTTAQVAIDASHRAGHFVRDNRGTVLETYRATVQTMGGYKRRMIEFTTRRSVNRSNAQAILIPPVTPVGLARTQRFSPRCSPVAHAQIIPSQSSPTRSQSLSPESSPSPSTEGFSPGNSPAARSQGRSPVSTPTIHRFPPEASSARISRHTEPEGRAKTLSGLPQDGAQMTAIDELAKLLSESKTSKSVPKSCFPPVKTRTPLLEVSRNSSSNESSVGDTYTDLQKSVRWYSSPNAGGPVNQIDFPQELSIQITNDSHVTEDGVNMGEEDLEDVWKEENDVETAFIADKYKGEDSNEAEGECDDNADEEFDVDAEEEHETGDWGKPHIKAEGIYGVEVGEEHDSEVGEASMIEDGGEDGVEDGVEDDVEAVEVIGIQALAISCRRVSGRLAEEARLQAEEQARKDAAAVAAQVERETLEALARERKAEEERKRRGIRRIPSSQLIQPLSAEWSRKVDVAMSGISMETALALSPDGTILRRRAFGTLLPQPGVDSASAWLNDEMVSGYLQLVVKDGLEKAKHRRGQSPRYHAFSTFFYENLALKGYEGVDRWARRAKLEGKDLLKAEYVLVPVHHRNHWTLLVVSPLRKTVEYFDSYHGNGRPFTSQILKWVAGELGSAYKADEWKVFNEAGSPDQLNAKDCGVFVATTARMIVSGWNPLEAYTKDDLKCQRRRMAAELMQGGFGEELAWKEE